MKAQRVADVEGLGRLPRSLQSLIFGCLSHEEVVDLCHRVCRWWRDTPAAWQVLTITHAFDERHAEPLLLRALTVTGTHGTLSGYNWTGFKQLSSLTLHNHTHDDTLTWLLASLPCLSSLSLLYFCATDRGLEVLSTMNGLRHLVLHLWHASPVFDGDRLLTTNGLFRLAALSNLETLCCRAHFFCWGPLPWDAALLMRNWARLIHLEVDFPLPMSVLAQFQHLTTMKSSNTYVEGLGGFVLPCLRVLHLSFCRIGAATHWNELAHTQIHTLDLAEVFLDDVHAEALATISSLVKLDISGANFSARGLGELARLPLLADLTFMSVDDEAIPNPLVSLHLLHSLRRFAGGTLTSGAIVRLPPLTELICTNGSFHAVGAANWADFDRRLSDELSSLQRIEFSTLGRLSDHDVRRNDGDPKWGRVTLERLRVERALPSFAWSFGSDSNFPCAAAGTRKQC